MTLGEWTAAPAMRVALAAFALALGTATWALAGAVRRDEVTDVEPSMFATADALAPRAPAPATDIRAAVESDPFQADRSAPAVRYRMPGDKDPSQEPPPAEPEPPVVLGTATGIDGAGFATCQLPGGNARIVHVGDRLGDFTVKAIERGHVVFTAPNGKQLDIPALR